MNRSATVVCFCKIYTGFTQSVTCLRTLKDSETSLLLHRIPHYVCWLFSMLQDVKCLITGEKLWPDRGLNSGSSAYRADTLPLSYWTTGHLANSIISRILQDVKRPCYIYVCFRTFSHSVECKKVLATFTYVFELSRIL